MAKDKISGSRFGRLRRLGWLGRRALPMALARSRGGGARGDDPGGDDPKADKRAAKVMAKHTALADRALDTLGDMKGIALKVGQMLSYMDGAVPEGYEALYQDALARLQRAAPSLPWRRIASVLEAELGPLSERFASIEEAPFAAASIGQVHRAVLPTGEAVAVTVQYPGVARAVAADLNNAALFRSLAMPFVGALGMGKAQRAYTGEILGEIRARLTEELDYAREARQQMRFRALLADDPDVLVPRVFEGWSTDRVLTSELVVGRGFDEVCRTSDQPSRDRYARILTRTLLHTMHDHGLFHADPHPGNYLFCDDGRVCLLDFGCVKAFPPAILADMQDYVRRGVRASITEAPADWDAFYAALARALRLEEGADPEVVEVAREYGLYIMRPALTPGVFDFTRAYARESVDRLADASRDLVWGDRRLPRVPQIPMIPPDYTFLNRLQFGFYSILTALGARIDWQALIPERVLGPELAAIIRARSAPAEGRSERPVE